MPLLMWRRLLCHMHRRRRPPRAALRCRHHFYRTLLSCAEALCSPATSSLLRWRAGDSSSGSGSSGSGRTVVSALAQLPAQARGSGRAGWGGGC